MRQVKTSADPRSPTAALLVSSAITSAIMGRTTGEVGKLDVVTGGRVFGIMVALAPKKSRSPS